MDSNATNQPSTLLKLCCDTIAKNFLNYFSTEFLSLGSVDIILARYLERMKQFNLDSESLPSVAQTYLIRRLIARKPKNKNMRREYTMSVVSRWSPDMLLKDEAFMEAHTIRLQELAFMLLDKSEGCSEPIYIGDTYKVQPPDKPCWKGPLGSRNSDSDETAVGATSMGGSFSSDFGGRREFCRSQEIVGADGIGTIAKSLAKSTTVMLTVLRLNSCAVTDVATILLVSVLKSSPALQVLDLSNFSASLGRGATASQRLTHDVTANMIGDIGMCALASALPLCASLTHLDVSRNPVGDEGGRAIARQLSPHASPPSPRGRSCPIVSLRMNETLVSRSARQLLDVLADSPTFRELHLQWCPLPPGLGKEVAQCNARKAGGEGSSTLTGKGDVAVTD